MIFPINSDNNLECSEKVKRKKKNLNYESKNTSDDYEKSRRKIREEKFYVNACVYCFNCRVTSLYY